MIALGLVGASSFSSLVNALDTALPRSEQFATLRQHERALSDPDFDEYTPEMLARMSGMIRDFVPHNKALGLEVIRVSRGDVWVKLPWAEQLVGNPVTGALHGGAISSAMDATGGLAIMAKLGKPGSIATLDLRIDYMRAARRGEDVTIHASCYKVTKHVCFVRGTAYTTDEHDPVAALAGTFARKS